MKRYLLYVTLLSGLNSGIAQTDDISIDGLNFNRNGKAFNYCGISFFNAIYNPAFNETIKARKHWLEKLRSNGITVLRIWGQWDNKRGFIDTCPSCTLYTNDGELHNKHLETLKAITRDAEALDMVVLFVLFQRESWEDNIRLSDEASDRAVKELTSELRSYRNLIFQIWNEFDYRVIEYYKAIKSIDPDRLVTNSPGYGGVLGSSEENRLLDFLSPHTSRDDYRHWNLAPKEIAFLMAKYAKPVVDDEPARRGTPDFGGPKVETSPVDHIIHMYNVLRAGGHVIYHHDMFQTGYGTDAIPQNGIPDPDFSPYHRQVFDFLKNREKYFR
jgi:hypothetical protein